MSARLIIDKNLKTLFEMFMNSEIKAIMQKLTRCLSVLLMLLLLTSCETFQNQPSVVQTPTGNAWAITLPKGSLVSTSEKAIVKLRAVAVNEMKDDVFVKDVVLVSKSYIIERDKRELKLMESLEEAKIK